MTDKACKIEGQIEEAKQLLIKSQGDVQQLIDRIKRLEEEKNGLLDSSAVVDIKYYCEKYYYKIKSIEEDRPGFDGRRHITLRLNVSSFSGDGWLDDFYTSSGFHVVQCCQVKDDETLIRFKNG